MERRKEGVSSRTSEGRRELALRIVEHSHDLGVRDSGHDKRENVSLRMVWVLLVMDDGRKKMLERCSRKTVQKVEGRSLTSEGVRLLLRADP
jgi:hypothetical protein